MSVVVRLRRAALSRDSSRLRLRVRKERARQGRPLRGPLRGHVPCHEPAALRVRLIPRSSRRNRALARCSYFSLFPGAGFFRQKLCPKKTDPDGKSWLWPVATRGQPADALGVVPAEWR